MPATRIALSLLIPLGVSTLLSIATAADSRPSTPRELVTSGVGSFGGGMLVSRVECRNPQFAPLAWASKRAIGGDKLGLQGTLPVPSWLGPAGRGRVVIWGAHEGFFGSGADGKLDNDRLRENLLAWLLDGDQRLGFTNTHGEWLTAGGFSPALNTWLDGANVSHGDVGEALTPEVLAGYDCLVIGNPWGEFTKAENNALKIWVLNGGGLLLLGLGWSWHASHADPTGLSYPVNQLAWRFRCQVLDGTITDPSAPNGDSGQPAFAVRPLGEYAPARVAILRSSAARATREDSVQQLEPPFLRRFYVEPGVDEVKRLAQTFPGDIFIVEGQYMGLQLPTVDWAKLDSPSKMIAILDSAYEAELELVGGANRPYGGAMIWYVAADDPQGAYWFHSGNQIVFKQEAAQEIVDSFNAGWPGWGMLHEQGHNMVITACNNLFVHSGTAEPWCNVFTEWAIHRMGWPEREGSYSAGHAYNAQAQPDFSQLTTDPWILLGCLELIWSKYGWEGMQRFMTQTAQDAAAGKHSQSDAEATAYFVEQLSAAYGRDFAPLIAHWGFSVSDASRAITAQYPPAEIGW